MAKQLIGDIDNDGKISVIDMLLIFMYKSGAVTLNADELQRADVDGDGDVTLADALAIQKHIEGIDIIDEVIV